MSARSARESGQSRNRRRTSHVELSGEAHGQGFYEKSMAGTACAGDRGNTVPERAAPCGSQTGGKAKSSPFFPLFPGGITAAGRQNVKRRQTGSPHRLDAEFPERRVAGHQRHLFDLRLCGKHAIEGIAMIRGKAARPQSMRVVDR